MSGGMDTLDQYRIFMRVAEMASFIKAANAMDLPRASVSAAIAQLESGIGARLLHRTTRKVHLTADGEQLLERVRSLLADAEDIDQLFQAQNRQISGCLSIDAPSRVARRLIAPALPSLLRRHPRLQIRLSSTDRSIDLVQEGVDGAVRVGSLPDSSLAVRPIGRLALVNCASPAYLSEHGRPEQVDELAVSHLAVGYASPTTGRELPWEYVADGLTHTLAVPSQVVVNNAESYIACCLAGLGLIQIPYFDIRHLLDSGELIEVMPDRRANSMEMSFVYPHRRQRARRLAEFIDWFEVLVQPHLE